MTRDELLQHIDEVRDKITLMRKEAATIPTRAEDIRQAEEYLEKLYNTQVEDIRVVTLRKKLSEEEADLTKKITEVRQVKIKNDAELAQLTPQIQNAREELEKVTAEANKLQEEIEKLTNERKNWSQQAQNELNRLEEMQKRMDEAQKNLLVLEEAKLEAHRLRLEAQKAQSELAVAQQEKLRLENELEANKVKLQQEISAKEERLAQREKILNQGIVNLEKKEKILEIKKQKLIQYKNECEVYYNRLFKDLII